MDAIEDDKLGLVYPAIIKIVKRNYPKLNLSELTPGMTATVDIRTGDRKIIEYFLSPIEEVSASAAHER